MYIRQRGGKRRSQEKKNRGKCEIGIDRERRGRELVQPTADGVKKTLPLKNEDKLLKLG